ncbi:CBO0543 family protein [Marinisporobacter balticus]|uniref:Uncharacterized protein n=1 Tax=Marinisporobacter balticus TaxID=2018667 RepID=A0A4R2KMN2_9FIRM|nr:CBO0543 family protein [Marinisporobacter balticus]TCO74963.1 hypothetical protein EV214_11034 [Marinisporobacter balticus]
MNKVTWTGIFFYGNIIILIILLFILLDKRRLKELIPIALFISIENYTVEILGLHYHIWKYPLENPGYPEVTILSSLIYFPIVAMLFSQYLSKNIKKNILLIILFVSMNMIIEVITLKTSYLFIYGEKMNLWIAFFMYLSAYLLIILFKHFYEKLNLRMEKR